MVANTTGGSAVDRRWGRRCWALLGILPCCLGFGCWWLTEPLDDRAGTALQVEDPLRSASPEVAPVEPRAIVEWPEVRLEGLPAKKILLSALLQAERRLEKVDAYTATFRKQERLKGVLGPVQTLAMKTRHRPFALYFKFLEPSAGKEVVFAEGRHDNKVIAHGAGLSRFLVPRLAVAPDHPLALADSRHPVTEAGLMNLTTRLIGFRRKDLVDDEAETVLDKVADSSGKTRLRSVHQHPRFAEDRPFARVEVCYDPETFIPVEIRSFDWPQAGGDGELLLAEHYRYEDLVLNSPLTALDFDPANPNYSFHRY